MACKRCPHYVRHGRAGDDGQSIVFRDLCGLKMKKNEDGQSQFDEEACDSFTFHEDFDHYMCRVYQTVFQSGSKRNGVNPKDIQ